MAEPNSNPSANKPCISVRITEQPLPPLPLEASVISNPTSGGPPPLPPPNRPTTSGRPAILIPSVCLTNGIQDNKQPISNQYPVHRLSRPHNIRLPRARPRPSFRFPWNVHELNTYGQAVMAAMGQFVAELKSDLNNPQFTVRVSLLGLQYTQTLLHLYCLLSSLRLLRGHRIILMTCGSLSCRSNLLLTMCLALLLDMCVVIAVLCKRSVATALSTLVSAIFVLIAWLVFRPTLTFVQPLLAFLILTCGFWLSLRWIAEQHLTCSESNGMSSTGVCKHCAHHLSTVPI